MSALELRFFGHSTVLMAMDGVTVLTDPVLRGIGPIRRHGPEVGAELVDADVVVISHAHLDHLDLRSLKVLPGAPEILVPVGIASVLSSAGLHHVREVDTGDVIQVSDTFAIRPFPALHDGNRPPRGPRGRAIGFVFEGSFRVYFAGDTDLFPEMGSLAGSLDVAMLPVWGWGPRLGPGHMNPERAAEAAALLGARVTVPIHWGSLFPHGLHMVWGDRISQPPFEFQKFIEDAGTQTDVRVLAPGEATTIEHA